MEAKLEQTGWILEADAAVKLGVSRDVLRELRDGLTEGADWRKAGKNIEISAAAFLTVKKGLGVEAAPVGSDEPPAATAAQGEPVELTVHHVPKLNHRIVVAKKNGSETLVRVRVKNNANWMPGMPMKARPDAGYNDVFVLEGRCPRFRGRM